MRRSSNPYVCQFRLKQTAYRSPPMCGRPAKGIRDGIPACGIHLRARTAETTPYLLMYVQGKQVQFPPAHNGRVEAIVKVPWGKVKITVEVVEVGP